MRLHFICTYLVGLILINNDNNINEPESHLDHLALTTSAVGFQSWSDDSLSLKSIIRLGLLQKTYFNVQLRKSMFQTITTSNDVNASLSNIIMLRAHYKKINKSVFINEAFFVLSQSWSIEKHNNNDSSASMSSYNPFAHVLLQDYINIMVKKIILHCSYYFWIYYFKN